MITRSTGGSRAGGASGTTGPLRGPGQGPAEAAGPGGRPARGPRQGPAGYAVPGGTAPGSSPRGPAGALPARGAAGTGPGRHRSGPPGRRDPRGPGSAPPAAVRRDRLPRYWFANRLLLTLSGQKPVHWMLGHTVGPAYEQLVRLAPLAPLRPPPERSARPAPVVARCDEYRPEPHIIEAYARIASGDRMRALAFRLEAGRDDRWRCAAVDLGLGPVGPAARGPAGR